MSDTTIYERQIRALLGTASHLCEAVVLKRSRIGANGGRAGDRVNGCLPIIRFSSGLINLLSITMKA